MNEKTLTIISILGLVIALIIVAIGNPEINVSSGSEGQQNVISVSGNAELTVDPDKADLYVTVETEGATAKAAQETNKDITNNVMKALKDAGIKDEDMETSNYYLNRKTEWDPDLRKSVDDGYVLTHTLKVSTTNIEEVGKLADTAVSAGANRIDTISFGLSTSKEKEVRDEALLRASEVAKEKAQNLASALNIGLGKIKSVSESNYYFTPFNYAGRAISAPKADFAAEESVIAPQSVQVSSSVSVAFEIE